MNVFILLYLFAIAPKLFWERIARGKRHPGFLQRLGIKIPSPTKKPLIWIHAVSVGEVKAASTLFKELQKTFPSHAFLITTTTATGQAEAKRSIPEAERFGYLPIDLSWVARKWVRKLNPKLFILIESDFWPNLLKALRQNGTQIFLASGKLSERAAKRFAIFSFFAKKLFSYFDQICVQSEEHYQRFLPLISNPKKLHITGNLKLDLLAQSIDQTLQIPQPAITISCTHATEEEMILNALKGADYFILLAPRHPERFQEVAELLTQKKIPFSLLSDPEPFGRVLLIDAMGKLPFCYANSRLAVVAGSFAPHIGGHNVLEPCLYGVPVLFGPHTFGQKELVSLAIRSGSGRVVFLEDLQSVISNFLKDGALEKSMRDGVVRVMQSSRGAAARTVSALFSSSLQDQA